MTNRIQQLFTGSASQGRKLLSPYITAGDPNPELTVPLMHALVEAGADILELGIPFSDPMAEGPVIQAAMERALLHDVACEDVLEMVKQFRQRDDKTPIILMGYTNPIEFMGYENFASKATEAGVDGTIIVDLPPEESAEVVGIWKKYHLDRIYLCSPTTTDERMQLINEYGSGYLYYVSLKGVTGSSDLDIEQVRTIYQQRKVQVKLPLMVGFGIKTPEIAANIAQFADGVVVGAGLIKQIEQLLDTPEKIVQQVPSLIKAMREEMDKRV